MADRERFDVVVIGAGFNGLTLANYLLQAGLRVLVVERRLESGGGLSSEEPTYTGFWANTGQYVFDTLGLLPFHKELALDRVNVSFIQPDVQSALVMTDGRALVIYRELARTVEAIARVSPRDAGTWRSLHRLSSAGWPQIFGAAFRRAKAGTRAAAAATTEELTRLGRMSPREAVDDLFESEPVRALILNHLLVPRGIGLDDSATGHFVALAVALAGEGRLVHSGSHELAQGLWTAILRAGGDVWDLGEATRVLVERGRAIGVELADNQRVLARAVVSTIEPRETFRLAGDAVGASVRARLARFRPDDFSLFAVHLALREPPRFQAAAVNADVSHAFRYALGLETVADHAALWHAIRAGELPDQAAMFVSVPTVHDPAQARAGQHTTLLWHFVPRVLRGRAWKDVRDTFTAACIDRLRRYAPNVGAPTIIAAAAMSPDDHVAKFPNLASGLFGGRNSGGQLGAFRPVPELAGYRTPINGLYVAGASAAPGAGLHPASAIACAGVVAHDLRATRRAR